MGKAFTSGTNEHFMQEDLRERIARLEENMKHWADLDARLRKVERSVWAIGGGLAVLQILLQFVKH